MQERFEETTEFSSVKPNKIENKKLCEAIKDLRYTALVFDIEDSKGNRYKEVSFTDEDEANRFADNYSPNTTYFAKGFFKIALNQQQVTQLLSQKTVKETLQQVLKDIKAIDANFVGQNTKGINALEKTLLEQLETLKNANFINAMKMATPNQASIINKAINAKQQEITTNAALAKQQLPQPVVTQVAQPPLAAAPQSVAPANVNANVNVFSRLASAVINSITSAVKFIINLFSRKHTGNQSNPLMGKVEQPKVDQLKVKQPKATQPKVDQPKATQPVDQPKAKQPKADQPKVQRPKKVLDNLAEGNVAVKMLTDFEFIREALADTKSTKVRGPNPHARRIDKTKPKLVIDENNKESWEAVPPKQSSKTDLKSTSFSLLRKTGNGTLFDGTGSNTGGALGERDFAIGIAVDATKCRHAKHAFFKENALTRFKQWRLDQQGKGATAEQMQVFHANRLPDFNSLKDYVNASQDATLNNELYTHISKASLIGVVIRSQAMFADEEIKIRAICEKIKLETKLNITGLPIIVVNANGKPFEYSFAEQKKDMEAYMEKNKDEVDRYGILSLNTSAILTKAEAETHFSTNPDSVPRM